MSVFDITRVVLMLQVLGIVQGYVDYEDLSELGDDDSEHYANYDDVDDTDAEAETSDLVHTEDDVTINRFRRHQKKVPTKTLSPEDIREVRGALKQLLAGIDVENAFNRRTTPPIDYRPSIFSNLNISSTPPTNSIEPSSAKLDATLTSDILTGDDYMILSSTYLMNSLQKRHKDYKEYKMNSHFSSPSRSTKFKIKSNIDRLTSILYMKEDSRRNFLRDETPTTTSNDTNITTTTKSVRTSVYLLSSRELDIPRLLAIISDLAKDFETNLTRKLNETLINMSIPSCTTPTTTTEPPPITDAYDANYTGAVVAKCFVCGLDIPQIPQHSHCADAFAGDFLPLVPVDASAKGKISRFRKYCKYKNIQGYRYNRTQPRTIFGRWTGGCAVRWIDLSGVYTQRTCRNRMQPALGKHFASKRMAKLERALWNVENGCIISPMATLVPLSRGVSLYARFHACVCSGNWCNAADPNASTLLINLLVPILVLGVTSFKIITGNQVYLHIKP